MSELTFRLEAFEGPLDLLLHLITKHKLNIYDIEISLLLDQYLEYIDSLDEQDFDAAGDFLAMAARLVYIKTCSLLPQAEEAEEMKKELQGELIEYSVCKEAAARLRRECVYGDVFVRPPEKIPVNMTFTGTMPAESLVEAYMGMTAKARKMRPVRAEQFSPIVASRIVTVTSKIVYVLKKLYKVGQCTVVELYDNVTDKSARVATFLAVLELAKSGRIYLNDDNTLICFNKETPRRHTKQSFVDEPAAPQESPVESKQLQDETPESEQAQEQATEQELISEEIQQPEQAPEPIAEPEPAAETAEEPQSYPEPETDETEDITEDEPVHIAKYALEPVSRTHSLAVPVYIEVPAEQPLPEAELSVEEAIQEGSAETASIIEEVVPEELPETTPVVEEAVSEEPAEPVPAVEEVIREELTEPASIVETVIPDEITAPKPEAVEISQPETAEEIVPTPEPEVQTQNDAVTAEEASAVGAENTKDTKNSYSAKDNRFSARWRWGSPAQTSNCWSYWRERL